MSDSTIKKIRLIIVAFSLIILMVLVLVSMPLLNKLLVVLVMTLFLISLFNFKLGFLLILFIRPIIDLSVYNVIFSIGALSVNALSLYGLMMFVISFFYIHTKKNNWRYLSHRYLFIAWVLFLGIGILTIFNSFSLAETAKDILRYLSIFYSFLVGFFILKDSKDLSLLIKVIIWSALVPAVLSLFQIINKTGLPDDKIYRAFGTFTHPNMLAFFLTLAITMAIFLILNIRKTRLEVHVYSLLATLYTIILFFTYTRGAYLVILTVLFIIGITKFRKFLIVSFIFLLFLYVSLSSVQSRFDSIFENDLYGSIAWRFDLWRDAYGYVKEKPLTGYGLGTAQTIIAINRDYHLVSSEPHNDYLQIALDGGYPLLLAYLVLISSLLIAFLRSYLQEERPRLKSFFIFLPVLSISIFVMSSGDNLLNNIAMQWQLWSLAGASLACSSEKIIYVSLKKPA